MSKYSNIDYFYLENKESLLESDEYRLCKSIPRDIIAYVKKFVDYYITHKSSEGYCVLSEDTITYDVLALKKWNDVVTTAKRIMKELNFLVVLDKEEYATTVDFDVFVTSNISIETFLTENLKKIHSMKDMTMLYNSIICTLRDGYLHDKILVFPDSFDKFARAVTNANDRLNFRKRVFDTYGFAGRYRDYTRDDYTPNANYRIITVLHSLGFIRQTISDFEDVRAYELTSNAHQFLHILNENLGGLTEEKFENLIKEENDFQLKLNKLALQYGADGNLMVTHQARLPQVQTAFRDRLIKKYGQRCMMCDITNKDLLIASHIKRASDENIYGKADFNNGFLLCAIHDKLFDKYLISFNCLDGKIMISKTLTEDEIILCGLNKDFQIDEDFMTEERMDYLMDHNNIFLKKESER